MTRAVPVERPTPTRSGYLEVPEEDLRIYWDYFGHGCGHLTYFEQPDVFWGHLEALARARSTDYDWTRL